MIVNAKQKNVTNPSKKIGFWARVVIGGIRFFMFDEEEQAFQLVEQLLIELPYVIFFRENLKYSYG
jgi:hypothetical protein